jgi:DNA invertase Pin-like site-specific DNA recombinase
MLRKERDVKKYLPIRQVAHLILEKGLIDALEFCRQGDSLCVWKLDRLGRSLRHFIDTINQLQSKGVEFVSLQECVDTTTSGENLSFTYLEH